MDALTTRDLRNHGDEVIDRVSSGVTVTVTRNGRPGAELRPIRPRALSATTLLERWRHLPVVDAAELRRDIDHVIDQSS